MCGVYNLMICECCGKNKGYYTVRIIDKTMCLWCYTGRPIPQDGKVYQSTDWSVVVTQ
jgi:hypothetical protein